MPLGESSGNGRGGNPGWDRFRVETRYTFATVLPERCPAVVPGPFEGVMTIAGLYDPTFLIEWEWPSADLAVDKQRKADARRIAEMTRDGLGIVPYRSIVERLGDQGTVFVLPRYNAIYVIMSSCGVQLLDAAFLHVLLRLEVPLQALDEMATELQNEYWPLFREV